MPTTLPCSWSLAICSKTRPPRPSPFHLQFSFFQLKGTCSGKGNRSCMGGIQRLEKIIKEFRKAGICHMHACTSGAASYQGDRVGALTG